MRRDTSSINRIFDHDRGLSTVIVLILVTGILIASALVVGEALDTEDPQTRPETSTETEIPAQITVETDRITKIPTSTTTSSPTPPPTSTLDPTSSSTPTFTPTATATPDNNPYSDEKYEKFVSTFYGEAEVDADVPLKLRGWTVVEGKVLIVAMNLTSPEEDDIRRVRQVNTLISSGYAQAVFHYDNGKIAGKIPSRLRIAEVNNTGSQPKTLHVNTSLARDYYLNKLEPPEFSERYWETERNMTMEEEIYIRGMDKSAENVTLYNETGR